MKITKDELITRAFDEKFELTKEEAKDVIELFEPSELIINWVDKTLTINHYNLLFLWSDKQ